MVHGEIRQQLRSQGARAVVMDALRPPRLPLFCLSCPPPCFHPILPSCPFLGHWPVVLGVEEPADSSGGDAGRLEPSVHESAPFWRSCQWETTQQRSSVWSMCPRGTVLWRETETLGPDRPGLAPPLTSSVTLGSHSTSPSLPVLLCKVGLIASAPCNSQNVEGIK